jgi:branched-chain amino acid aminotransferase
MAQMYDWVFFGDKLVPKDQATLSIGSSAVLYGLSVYTVFPVCITKSGDLVAFRLQDHFERLCNSAKIIGLDTFPGKLNYKTFNSYVEKVIAKNKIKSDVYVRATDHVVEEIAGTRSRGLRTELTMFVYDAVPILDPKGARLKTSHWRRVPDISIPARAKVNGAYVNSVLAKQEALDSGYDDCIFLDIHGHVSELSAANIFLVRKGRLITPGVESDVLEGINRDSILQIAKDLRLDIVERNVDRSELYVADEVFACGTSANISPVLEIDGRQIGTGKIGKITSQIQELHNKIRHGEEKRYSLWLSKI